MINREKSHLLLLCILPYFHLLFGFVPVSIFQPTKTTTKLYSMPDPNPHFQASFVLTSGTVERALAAAEQHALSNGWKVSIAISDAGGVPLLVKRCDGAFPASVKVAIGKAETAAQFCKSTAQLESAVNVIDGTSRAALLSSPYLLMRGGVPIFLNDICCGAVGVSGVKPEEDEQIALTAVNYITSLVSKL
ncbi:hypothetical protein ACHAW6_013736 [Cyclotella cf. meneghiniana]